MSEPEPAADRRRLDITRVPDGHYIVEVRDWEEILVEAEDVPEAREKAIRQSKLPNPKVARAAPHIDPTDDRRKEVNIEP